MIINTPLPDPNTGFSADDLELLAYLLEEEGIEYNEQRSIGRRANQQEWPLSFAQERLWVLDQLAPDSSTYVIPCGFRLKGHLHIPALQKAISTIVSRHEVLRSTFPTIEGHPAQIIVPPFDIAMPVVDLQSLEAGAAEALRIMRQEAQRPFNLAQGPLLRTMLLRLGTEEHLFLLTVHHIVFDGWSIGLFIHELKSLYQAFCANQQSSLADLPIQYADFAAWQRTRVQGAVLDQESAYWKQQLADIAILELPTDRPRPPVQSFRGSTFSFSLPPPLYEKLLQLSQRENITLFMALLAAFQIFLFRYTGEVDIAVGTPIANRDQIDTEPLIGLLINTLILRTDLSGNPSFKELLQRVRKVTGDAFTHQNIPFEKLVVDLQSARDLSHNPLTQVLFIYQKTGLDELALPGLILESLQIDTQTSKFDLTLTLQETAQGLGGTFEYATDLFDAATIVRMAGHYQRLLAGIVQDASQPIEALPLLTAAERQLLLEQGTATATPFPQTLAVHQLFEARAAAHPDAVALIYEQQVLTYAALNRRANQLGHALRRLGVGPDTLVALCVERSPELLIGMLGILKAGAAYLPLDPAYPHERLAFMLQDAQVPVLLTQQRLVAQLPTAGLHLLCLDTDWATVAQEPASQPTVSVTPDRLLYVLYTSGSTGTPKGVMITHRNVVNFLQAMRRQPGMTEQDILLAITSFSFDIAALELFLPLVTGARLVLAEQSALADGARLAAYLTTFAITIMQATPATWQLLVAAGWQGHAALKILTGGEAISRTLADQLLARAAEVWNMYGPTETTIWSSCARIEAASAAISLGHPIDNTDFYVLDPHQQPVPIGVPGQLYIGGAGLARGYLYRPELTAEQFVPHPWSRQPGERLYQTGDRVQMRADGSLRFLGRLDNQVKLRGFRIELREIEIAIDAHPSIRAGVVVARADGAGGQRLVAYLVAEPGPVPTVAELRTFLMHRLPDYMLPASFVMLDALPLTPNGKVQYRALPAPLEQRPATEIVYLPPTNEVEHTIATIWQELLHIEKVGVHDNFFELGGDSIMSIQIIAKANQAGIQLKPKQLFQHQTIYDLAKTVDISPMFYAERGLVTGFVPLTPSQYRFFEQDTPEPNHFNQAVMIELIEPLDRDLITNALHYILIHHDALRMRFTYTDEGWQQYNADAIEQPLVTYTDLASLPETEQEITMLTVVRSLQASLNLEKGPLLHAALFSSGSDQPVRLLLLIHYLVIDRVSWKILLEDLQTICHQLKHGHSVILPPKTTSFKTWAARLAEYAQTEILDHDMVYWQRAVDYTPERLLVDYPEGINTEESACTISMILDSEETEQLLHQAPRVYNTPIDYILISALAIAYKRWTGHQRMFISLESHGREAFFDDINFSRTVGCFTACFPVFINTTEASRPKALITAIKAQLENIPNHGISYSLLRYLRRDTDISRFLQSLPEAEISFNYYGQADQVIREGKLFRPMLGDVGPTGSPAGTRAFLLDINATVVHGQLRIEWTYSSNIHQKETIEMVAELFIEALKSLNTQRSSRQDDPTPADFPAAQLNQEELNKFLRRLSKSQ